MPVSMSNHLTKHYHMESKMPIVTRALICAPLLCSSAWAVEAVMSTPPVAPTTAPVVEAMTSDSANPAHTRQSNGSTVQIVKVAATPNASASNTINASTAPDADNKPLTAEQIAKQKALNDAKVKALVKDQATRLQELEKANLDALAQNQELQLKNDNLGVQIEVLQSERSAQMFIYGAATIAVGIFCGFLMASYIYTKRRRQW